jgi:rhodanese-related sulfurtransferase
MKKLIGVFLLALVVVFVYAAPPALAEDDNEGLGDYVHASLGSGPRLDIAPGLYGHIAARADAFLAGTFKTIFAADLKKKMDAGEALFIVDVRRKADYDKGHIPGAKNIEFAALARPENLASLPLDGTMIVTVCYTGHMASQSHAILSLLGYNVWTLRFGMISWNKGDDQSSPKKNAQKIWSSSASQVIFGADYPLEVTP